MFYFSWRSQYRIGLSKLQIPDIDIQYISLVTTDS